LAGLSKLVCPELKLHSILKGGVSDIDAQRAALREFNRYKEGLVETAGSFSMYGGAWLLHTYYGGDTWHTIKVQDQEYDISALFPLVWLYASLSIQSLEQANGEPQRNSLEKDASEILFGLSTRRGAAAPALQEFLQAMASEETSVEDAAKSFFEYHWYHCRLFRWGIPYTNPACRRGISRPSAHLSETLDIADYRRMSSLNGRYLMTLIYVRPSKVS
jgi:hypothetical protein